MKGGVADDASVAVVVDHEYLRRAKIARQSVRIAGNVIFNSLYEQYRHPDRRNRRELWNIRVTPDACSECALIVARLYDRAPDAALILGNRGRVRTHHCDVNLLPPPPIRTPLAW